MTNRPRRALAMAFNKSIATELETKFRNPETARRLATFTLTPQQETFLAALRNDTSILLEAVAGSGKSATLLAGMLAVPAQWAIATCNAVGHRAWASKVGTRLRVDRFKTSKIIDDLPATRNFEVPFEMRQDVSRLVALGKTFGIVPNAAPKPRYTLMPDTIETWLELAALYNAEANPILIDWARIALEESIKAAREGLIDFDDQLYMTVCYAPHALPKYDLIFIDEVQDLSAIQHTMLSHMLMRGGQIVGAGDRAQAIYGFRGAMTESIPELIARFNMTPLPLTISWRCSRAVVREAQAIVPTIEAAPTAVEGSATWAEGHIANLPAGIACRNTAPLVALTIRLLGAGINATVMGRDIGATLKALIDKAIGSKKKSLPLTEFFPRLHAKIAELVAAQPRREETLNDQAEAIAALAEPVSDTAGLKRTIDRVFSEGTAAVTLGTVHRMKGLEFPTFAILDPWRMPSRFAKQPWEITQEDNLRYVAQTRAQVDLTYADFDHLDPTTDRN